VKLYLFRHGHAERGENKSDFKRELTEKGIERTTASAKALVALNAKPMHLFSSPLVRARQTADILAAAFGMKVDVREEVGPGFGKAAIEKLIAAFDNSQDVMFVGHEPDFSTTVSELTGGGRVVMKKGGMARIDVLSRSPLRGELVWLLTPKVMARAETDDD
jgi:phosphohistidine phosphatase